MVDALEKLTRFSWRDQEYPITRRRVSFAHEGAEHRIQFRDNDFVQPLGAHSLFFSYTLPMRQGIAKGPYKDLFTTGYPLLFAAMRDREKGVLVDPVLGEFVCVPQTWTDAMDVAMRDGTDVEVEFKHSPDVDEIEDPKTITLQGVTSDAGALDAELSKVDWEQEPSPGPTMDALNAISGVGAQLEAQSGKVAAALEDFAYKCEKIDQQIDRLQNPDVWPLKRAVRRNRSSAVALAKRAQDPTKEIVRLVISHTRTIVSLASELNMTIEELLQQNPALARAPFVPAGTPINALKKKRGRAA
ncbi:DNA circularization protein N-terminus [Caudoviricetes sp.]|nr:DNA circularization protein N-terminus [Caudoviricetes sp.]